MGVKVNGAHNGGKKTYERNSHQKTLFLNLERVRAASSGQDLAEWRCCRSVNPYGRKII